MKEFKFFYSDEKNKKLIQERGIGFEDVIQAAISGNILKFDNHHNLIKYPNQKLMFVRITDQVYVVPFVEQSQNCLYLKTIFPSRKAKKRFLSSKKEIVKSEEVDV